MRNIQSTTRFLKDISRTAEPGELVGLLFELVRQAVHVERALVVSRAGLSFPQYRLVHHVGFGRESSGAIAAVDELRQGGVLAKLLYLGEFQNITRFALDDSDPASDLLLGSRSLMAFPLFENGSSVGMVVMLGSSIRAHGTTEMCALAILTSLLGRAIEMQKLATQLEIACHSLDSELQAAADVQRWLLPPSAPSITNTKIAASYRTACRCGGDYYDLVELPDGRVGALIADVSGKGAAAAMLMAVLRTILHELRLSQMTGPAALLDYADSRLCTLGLPQRGVFVTAFSCTLDPATGTLTYSSAGHNPPRLLRGRQRAIVPLDGANSTPLGLFNKPCTHTEEAVVLTPGDLVVLYTDGITEARSPRGEFFGDDRLDEILRALPEPVTPASAVEAVRRAVDQFGGTGPLSDDQVVLALCPEVDHGESHAQDCN